MSRSMGRQRIKVTQAFADGLLCGPCRLEITDGVITALDDQPGPADCAVAGLITPGFVDLQVNGGGGVLINDQPSVEGFHRVAEVHRRFGTVAILPTVLTDHPDVMAEAVTTALKTKDQPGIAGLHLEGPHIATQKRGTHDPRHIRPLDEVTMGHVARLRAADVPVMITLAPEAASPPQITALAKMGAIVSLGHSGCSATAAAEAFAAGARSVTHLFNAMSGMSARAPGLAGAALVSDAAVGLICDGIHVDDTMLRLACQMPGAVERCFLVSDAMPTVGGPESFRLYGQEIRQQAGRLINAEGRLAGAHTTMLAGLSRLAGKLSIPLQDALRMTITTPARLLGRPDLSGLVGRRSCDIMVLNSTGKKGLSLQGSLTEVIANQPA